MRKDIVIGINIECSEGVGEGCFDPAGFRIGPGAAMTSGAGELIEMDGRDAGMFGQRSSEETCGWNRLRFVAEMTCCAGDNGSTGIGAD